MALTKDAGSNLQLQRPGIDDITELHQEGFYFKQALCRGFYRQVTTA
jgi:hypothetical protein